MNSELNNFFKEERKRVIEPGPYFVPRTMARVLSQKAEAVAAGVWDVVPGATRPVLALSLMVLFGVLGVQLLVPVEPARGAIEAYVGQDLTPRERMLFTDAQVSPGSAQFEELMVLEPLQ